MNRVKIMHGFLLVALLLLVTACGAKGESAAEKLKLQADGLTKLVIDHRNGDIKILGSSDSDKIEVDALAKADGVSVNKLELRLEAQEDTAYLDARFRGQFLATGSGAVDLEIKVPKQLDLEIKSHRDGDVRISELSSNAKIDNINGDIQVSNLSGSLEIDNRDGDITIREIGSDVVISNINGHISADQVGGSVEVQVGDGSLDVDHVAKDVSITQSGNGEIKIGEVKGRILQNK
ncbi:hypothetical protein V3851_12100 [Paenibacillus sp. M1]|uniref:Adhesin domain-containing protein n=1 Tax=Paenibacillus haidiansis TaxID=1574488 RepID=A0ABU7VS20_9BACL